MFLRSFAGLRGRVSLPCLQACATASPFSLPTPSERGNESPKTPGTGTPQGRRARGLMCENTDSHNTRDRGLLLRLHRSRL